MVISSVFEEPSSSWIRGCNYVSFKNCLASLAWRTWFKPSGLDMVLSALLLVSGVVHGYT